MDRIKLKDAVHNDIYNYIYWIDHVYSDLEPFPFLKGESNTRTLVNIPKHHFINSLDFTKQQNPIV